VREKYCWLVADKPSEQGDTIVQKRAVTKVYGLRWTTLHVNLTQNKGIQQYKVLLLTWKLRHFVLVQTSEAQLNVGHMLTECRSHANWRSIILT
jgi:hypothetical protein